MSDDGRATSLPTGLQRLIDRDLFPAVPVWRGKGAQALRDKFAKANELGCLSEVRRRMQFAIAKATNAMVTTRTNRLQCIHSTNLPCPICPEH